MFFIVGKCNFQVPILSCSPNLHKKQEIVSRLWRKMNIPFNWQKHKPSQFCPMKLTKGTDPNTKETLQHLYALSKFVDNTKSQGPISEGMEKHQTKISNDNSWRWLWHLRNHFEKKSAMCFMSEATYFYRMIHRTRVHSISSYD